MDREAVAGGTGRRVTRVKMTLAALAAASLLSCSSSGDGGGTGSRIGAVNGWPDPLTLEWGVVPDGDYVLAEWMEIKSSRDLKGKRVAPFAGTLRVTNGKIDLQSNWDYSERVQRMPDPNGFQCKVFNSAKPIRCYQNRSWPDLRLTDTRSTQDIYLEGGMTPSGDFVLFVKSIVDEHGDYDPSTQVVRCRFKPKQ